MIEIQVVINSNIIKVWNKWNNPDDIVKWYSGHQDWYTSESNNNLEVGKPFTYLMKSKESDSFFYFKGVYTEIDKHQSISYLMKDNRKIKTTFQKVDNVIIITKFIESETLNSKDSQSLWWQTILKNFKNYVEL